MRVVSYRLCKETCGVCAVEGKPSLVTLPEGSVVTTAGEPSQVTGMIAVMWGTATVRVFLVDLEERGEIVKSFAA